MPIKLSKINIQMEKYLNILLQKKIKKKKRVLIIKNHVFPPFEYSLRSLNATYATITLNTIHVNFSDKFNNWRFVGIVFITGNLQGDNSSIEVSLILTRGGDN